ncbi:MAG: hypothetical protein U9Q70_09580 [Chloroflexota bacterium]|nr:hypothetical protein [Chloroflexota bacterium]
MSKVKFVSVFMLLVLLLSAVPGAVLGQEIIPGNQLEDAAWEELVAKLIRCVDLDGEQYCFCVGFIDLQSGSAEWQKWLSAALAEEDSAGDMSLTSFLQTRARLSPEELRKIEEKELESARSAVGGIKLANYLAEPGQIPEDFFKRYPTLGIAIGSPQAEALRQAALTGEPLDLSAFHTPTDLEAREEALVRDGTVPGKDDTSRGEIYTSGAPNYRYIIYPYYREQVASNYCGVVTMESFADADGYDQNQYYWAEKLGTDTIGYTYIGNLIPVINDYTNWNSASHGGDYAVVSVAGKDQSWFVAQHEERIGIYGAPIAEHVNLWKMYFEYLQYNHGGHFQTGRGYSQYSDVIAIFEPYDERDWYSHGNHTGKRQYVPFNKLWGATQIHPQQNFGR